MVTQGVHLAINEYTRWHLEKPIGEERLGDKNSHSVCCNTLIYNTFTKYIIQVNHGHLEKPRITMFFEVPSKESPALIRNVINLLCMDRQHRANHHP